MTWDKWLLLLGVLGAMFSIVPLMVWGGTGDWRRALQALRQYLGVLAVFAIGGVVGLIMVAAEWFNR